MADDVTIKGGKEHRPFFMVANQKLLRPDGSIVPFREMLRDYVSEEGVMRKNGGTHHKTYLDCQKKAKGEERNFYDVLLDECRGERETYLQLRQLLIATREIEATEEDVEGAKQSTAKGKYGDIGAILKAMNYDVNKASRVAHILYPEKLMSTEAGYHIMTKLVSGRVRIDTDRQGTDTLQDLRDWAAAIEPDLLLREQTLRKTCIEAAEEAYLKELVKDPDGALQRLEEQLNAESNESARMILGYLFRFSSEFDSLEVKGAKTGIEVEIDGKKASKPFPSLHQKVGVKKILDLMRVLIADEMGVGKTAQAILAFVELVNREPKAGHKMLIVCPGNLVEHWTREFEKYLTADCADKFKPLAIQSHNKLNAISGAKSSPVVIISYDMIKQSLKAKASQKDSEGEEGEDDGGSPSSDSDAAKFTPEEAKEIVDALGSMGFTYVTLDEVHRAKNPNYSKASEKIASKYLMERRKRRGKQRLLVTCGEEELANWEAGLRSICDLEKKPPKIAVVNNGSLKEAKNADIVIVPKEGASEVLAKCGHFDAVEDVGADDQYGECKRSATVRKLISSPKYGGAQYLVLLTGTPLPNRLSDIGNMASMLEPDTYPSARVFNAMANRNFRLIHELLVRRMLRRRIHQVVDMKPLHIKHEKVPLEGLQKDVYTLVQENKFDATVWQKLQWTRMAALDPAVLSRAVLRELSKKTLKPRQRILLAELAEKAAHAPSAKMDAVCRYVEEQIKNGEKVVVYSSLFRDGVIDELVARFHRMGIPIEKIDGLTKLGKDGGERQEVRDRFQTPSGPKVLVATLGTVVDGISLTAASKVVFLDYPYNDSDAKQGIGRVWRPGQQNEVEVVFFQVEGTVDEAGELRIAEKERISNFVIDGILWTKEEGKAFDIKKVDKRGPYADAVKNPRQRLSEQYMRMHAKGGRANRDYILADGGKNGIQYMKDYLFRFEESYSANVGRVAKSLIEMIEEEEGRPFRKMADLACGPAVLTRVSGRPTTCVDMNPFGLRLSKEEFGDLVEVHEGMLDANPLQSESHDLAVISLALHYAPYLPPKPKPEKKRRKTGKNGRKTEEAPPPPPQMGEREKILRETWRVLRPGGWMIISEIPNFVDPEGIKMMLGGLERLGFDRSEMVGFAKDALGEEKFEVFVLAVRKSDSRMPEAGPLEPETFVLNSSFDIRNIQPKGRKKKERAPIREPEGARISRFSFMTLDGEVTLLEETPPLPAVKPIRPKAEDPREELWQGIREELWSVRRALATEGEAEAKRRLEALADRVLSSLPELSNGLKPQELHRKFIDNEVDGLLDFIRFSGKAGEAEEMLGPLAEFDSIVLGRMREGQSDVIPITAGKKGGKPGGDGEAPA